MRITPLLPLLTLPTPLLASKPKDAVLLSGISSLTLRSNKQTTNRRVPAIPQLQCISSSKICALHTIDVMRCTNQGSSYDAEDIEWSCTASLPPELKLGSTDVICEGYGGPNDPYVLKGSCGVEYKLVLTEMGERKFPEIANGGGGWFSGWGGDDDGGRGKSDDESSGISGTLFGIIFVAVLLWILYSAWTQADAPGAAPRRPRPRNGWFGGGGGGFDPGFGPGGGGGGGYDAPPPYSKYGQNQEGWRPGFWSGLAGGAAAGYLAGNRGNRDRQEPRGFYGGGSSSTWDSRPGPSSSRRSQSRGDSMSSSRYTSTGFGSTSRR